MTISCYDGGIIILQIFATHNNHTHAEVLLSFCLDVEKRGEDIHSQPGGVSHASRDSVPRRVVPLTNKHRFHNAC